MEKILSYLRTLNGQSNDLLRKGWIILCVLLGFGALLWLFPYIAPFVVAMLLAAISEPLIRFLSSEDHRIRIPRKLASLLCTILLITILTLIIILMSSRIVIEVKALATRLPAAVKELVAQSNAWLDDTFAWLDTFEFFGEESMLVLRNYLLQMGRVATESAGPLANMLARSVLSTAFSLPQVLLFIVLTLLGTYYMSSDRERIMRYFRKLLPFRTRGLLNTMKSGMIRAVFGQIRAQVFLTMMMFLELLIGFSVMRVHYALILAFVISLLDALPVVGSGLFLLPWAGYGFLTGDFFIGFGMLLLYGITLVMRQLIEPRVVGAQLGVYPLATMMSMYAGFVMFGFLGMLLGPITFMLCRVTVHAVCGVPQETVSDANTLAPRRPLSVRKRK